MITLSTLYYISGGSLICCGLYALYKANHIYRNNNFSREIETLLNAERSSAYGMMSLFTIVPGFTLVAIGYYLS